MPDPSTLHLPRILCLHGGGVNAEVFELQCRAIIARLRPYFRLVFVNGPLPCAPHEKIVAVYGDQGPFFRWMPWLNAHSDMDDDAAAENIMRTCLDAMKRDSAAHSATGAWVGVLGFSQGAKIATSLLFAQEKAVKNGLTPLTNFRFGVIMAGSPPVVRLDTRLPAMPHVGGAGHITVEYDDLPEDANGDHALVTPTVHVLGLQDPDVARHRILLARYCKPGTARLVEWDGDHRLPIKSHDVTAVTGKILEMAEDADVI